MTIEERLTQLERKNRRLTLALVSVGMVAILAVAMGQGAPAGVPQEVTAHMFTLVDANGKPRGRLLTTKDCVGLGFYDENGKRRVELSLAKDGSGLALCDENGKPRATLVALKDGPSLGLRDENSKGTAVLGVFNNGPWLKLDTRGQSLVKIGTAEEGGGVVNIFNVLGKRIATIEADKKNCGMVGVYGHDGEFKSGLTGQQER